ncbi:MAG TPA: NusG domain II-containing protein [Spirochaetia bacterium]|nr:NusG domain II-containing protein [Spirochaetia bacterium]
MTRQFYVRPLDFVALLLAVLAVVGASIFAYGGSAQASEVSIENDEGTFLYPLDQDRLVQVSGPLGETVVEIEDGRVHVHESPCRDKICIAAGWLDATGQWTACLPNRVFVRVEGGQSEDGVDAQTF